MCVPRRGSAEYRRADTQNDAAVPKCPVEIGEAGLLRRFAVARSRESKR